MTPYSYCILRYLHDPSVGEYVNVGVLVYAPEVGFVRFKSEHRIRALSQLFGGFDAKGFIRFLSRLETSTETFQYSLIQSRMGMFEMEKPPSDAGMLARWLFADNNLSFQFGPTKAGIARDLTEATNLVFERHITSQRPPTKEHKRRDEEAVWNVFQNAFRQYGINRYLAPRVIQTPAFDLPFKHAYENERWHAVEPLSFDFARPEEIRDKAMLWYSYGAALKESEEFAQLYLLLGAPTNPDYQLAYEKAKRWLEKMPIHPQLIEERDAQEFARQLAETMKEEGVLNETLELDVVAE